jgi:putative Mg2+ transporter-C (MgtC) family protein
MQMWLAGPLLGGNVQGARHGVELLAAFVLTALIGLERTIQGKSAGLRTQTIVGTSSALIMLVSKYGFGDVLHNGTIVLDPSRVAAQIVSGIGFLGAGIIITRRAVHGLTTAAAVWESAELDADAHDIDDGKVRVTMTLSGAKMGNARDVFAELDGVIAVLRADDESD